VGDVAERLSFWDAITVPVLAQFPADIETMTGFDAEARPVMAQQMPGTDPGKRTSCGRTPVRNSGMSGPRTS
jgi:hypothetical protein